MAFLWGWKKKKQEGGAVRGRRKQIWSPQAARKTTQGIEIGFSSDAAAASSHDDDNGEQQHVAVVSSSGGSGGEEQKKVSSADDPRPDELVSSETSRSQAQPTRLDDFDTTSLGVGIIYFQGLASFLSCVLFIYESYEFHFEDFGRTMFFIAAEIILNAIFTLDLFMRMYLSNLRYTWSWDFVVDITTIVPGLLHLAEVGTENLGLRLLRFIRVLRTLKVLRVARVARLGAVLSASATDFRRESGMLAFILFCFVFCTAGLFQAVEKAEMDIYIPFHEVLKYMTCLMLGRTNLPAESIGANVIVIIIVPLSVAVIPIQLARLIKAWQRQQNYRSPYLPGEPGSCEHVLVCGAVNGGRLQDLLSEVFDADYDSEAGKEEAFLPAKKKLHVVILSPSYPTPAIKRVLRRKVFASNVVYINGSPMSEDGLSRAAAGRAKAAFVVSRSILAFGNSLAEDLKTVSICMSLKRHNRDMPLFVELLASKNAEHLRCLPDWHDGKDHFMCVDEAKLSMLAACVVCPGAPTLMANLACSRMEYGWDVMRHLTIDRSEQWAHEYNWGACHELYEFRLPKAWNGAFFSSLACYIYGKYGMIFVAVEQKVTLHAASARKSARQRARTATSFSSHVVDDDGDDDGAGANDCPPFARVFHTRACFPNLETTKCKPQTPVL